MTDKNKIEQLVNELINVTGIFLVAIKVSNANKISVLVDTMKGITIDECAELHRHLEKNLDRNIEDFELQVSSPGLDAPFLVIEQYRKNEGNKVEVADYEGNKFTGHLKNVTNGGFELISEVKGKGEVKMTRELSFNLEQVKSTRVVLTI